MASADQITVDFQIVIKDPVVGVMHSLQAKDGSPLDPKVSREGEPLRFDFPIRIGPGPKFFGDQVRREGPERRFVYVRIGQLAGDPASPWTRRMKIDIHDVMPALLDHAMADDAVIEITVAGTGEDGTPSCATVPPIDRRVIDRGSSMITAKHIPWEPIGAMPPDRKDGRRMLLWEEDQPVIGRWDPTREGWEDPESMQLFEEITHWADVNPPTQ